ncbi:MAG: hypothetical protein IPO15_04815 [Anaerolineae bacterium]|uniref:hypothetical protein n=1 Tax=Candidatus Amarolinea dominans TaxID=3140696 RepID=UPI0031366FAB|nr:hypothetical protein [Anaerolineae bacterium]
MSNDVVFDPQAAYSAVNPAQGTIYRLPLVDQPTEADRAVIHTYIAGEMPDQLAFDSVGNLYVSLALSNQISVLAANGTETVRYASAPGDAIPLDNPAGIAFDARTRSLLIVNHALLSGRPQSLHSFSIRIRLRQNSESRRLPAPTQA